MKNKELYGIKFKPSVYAYENNIKTNRGEFDYYFSSLEEAQKTVRALEKLYKQYDYVVFIVPTEQLDSIGRRDVVKSMEQFCKKLDVPIHLLKKDDYER